MNKRNLQKLLKNLHFTPQKRGGQTFLTDNNVRNKIISFAQIKKDEIILEVGAGLGALTEELVKHAREVIAYEQDPTLFAYLTKKFKKYMNIELLNQDVLKTELPPHDKVVSNLPFSATGELLEKLFFRKAASPGILMIEKKLADRIFPSENYKDFSRLTVSVNAFMTPIERFMVSRNSFYPRPKIDISVIKLTPKESLNPFLATEEGRDFFLQFIGGIFPYKNKNIVNALQLFMKNFSSRTPQKDELTSHLKAMGLSNQ
ncbi:MAG: ribosomal RNA small subunit methyltransferase A, partial [Promethearchaeota archaeon]